MKPRIGSGDSGETDLLKGHRVRKDSAVIEALGDIDEAVAAIGVARAAARNARTKTLLLDCQSVLRECATAIAARGGARGGFDFATPINAVEEIIARHEKRATRPRDFVTPGATQAEAALHLARAVVRRAERRVFALARTGQTPPPGVGAYLNRLSDLLFDLAAASSSRPRRRQ